MKRIFSILLYISLSSLLLGEIGESVVATAKRMDFALHRKIRKNSIDMLAQEEEWKEIPRESIVSNLVDFAIRSETLGKFEESKAALQILAYQPDKVEGRRLLSFSESFEIVSNKVSWINIPFTMMGADFAPFLEAKCRDGTWDPAERKAVYWTARQFLRSNGSSLRVPKLDREDRFRIGEALRTILPYEMDDSLFREVDWTLIENHSGWAFSSEHFELLSKRASKYDGDSPNPYKRILETMSQRLSEGNTNIVFSADLPILPPNDVHIAH